METIGSEIRKIRIDAVIAKAKQEILNDIREDRVPAGITSFSELHDYCDANEYGGLCEEHGDMSTEDAHRVQEALDVWIKAGNAELCVHCYTPVFWDESAVNYRHRQPTDGCPMALEPKPKEV